MSSDLKSAFDAAIIMLTRREHGAEELRNKLIQKGHGEASILAAIAECQRLGLQSDVRFAETISRVRIRQGYGPDRIRRELQQKQVDRDLIAQTLAAEPVDWIACAVEVYRKKYKSPVLSSYLEQQKQKQFLLYRGFSSETIAQVFAQMLEDCNDE